MTKAGLRNLGSALAVLAVSVGGSAGRAEDTSTLPPQKLNAAKLAGLAGFVNTSCETLRTDGERFRRAIQSMGVEPAELERDALLLTARAYLAAYQKDVPASCGRAVELFGQSGRIIPGLFVPR